MQRSMPYLPVRSSTAVAACRLAEAFAIALGPGEAGAYGAGAEVIAALGPAMPDGRGWRSAEAVLRVAGMSLQPSAPGTAGAWPTERLLACCRTVPAVPLLITDDPEPGVWVASNLLLTLFAALSEAALAVLPACTLPDHVVPCMGINLRSVNRVF